MEWESLGFKSNPLSTDPIKQETLDLYVGHEKEVAVCQQFPPDKIKPVFCGF